ncbi:MAG: hypothetical protein HQK63_15585, partial [Desulfamplus sp.]|nr:hypothetical protein [Desulfamplus sp.]
MLYSKLFKLGVQVKYLIIALIFILLTLICSNIVCSEDVNTSIFNRSDIFENSTSNWQIYNNRDFISSLALSDDKKTLWVGTVAGLEKRDVKTGLIEKVYTNLDGLLNMSIKAIVSDKNNGVWVGTIYGLSHILSDGSIKNFTAYNSNLPSSDIEDLYIDSDSRIWIAMRQHVGYIAENGAFEILDIVLDDCEIEAIMVDENGIWIGTLGTRSEYGKGLYRLNYDGTLENYTIGPPSTSNNGVRALLSDGSNGVWIGTGDDGLMHITLDGTIKKIDLGWPPIPSWDIISGRSVNSITKDSGNGLWVSTPYGLTHIISESEIAVIDKKYGLPMDIINVVMNDGEGGVWFGLGSGDTLLTQTNGGLAHINALGRITLYKSEFQIPNPFIFSLMPDSKNGLWVGSYGGLSHIFSDGTYKIYTMETSEIPNNICFSLASDSKGGLWIGTNNGLAYMDSDEEFDIYQPFRSEVPTILTGTIRNIISDGKDGVWIGLENLFGTGGLSHLKSDGSFENYTSENSDLPLNNVWGLALDNGQGLWIGSYGAGLAHLNLNGSMEIFSKENSDLPDNFITSLVNDSKGGVWIATDGGGVAHLDHKKSFEIFNSENSSLNSNYVRTLASDGLNNVLVGNFDGLSIINSYGLFETYKISEWSFAKDQIMSLLSDNTGGIWAGTSGTGLLHLTRIGEAEQIKANLYDLTITWFLNRSPFDHHKVIYIELQRSLSKNGVYETVLDSSDNPVRFYADYSNCQNPMRDDCWPNVVGHLPADKGSKYMPYKGYTLNTPINDPEWLEGLPRYYRLSAVIEEDGKLFRVANNQEAVLITPQVEEKPRVELTLDRNAIAMQPNQKAEITVFVSSLDLFRGDVDLEVESATGNPISNNINVKLEPTAVSLKSGETKPVLLTIEGLSESTQTIKIIPKIQSGYSGKSTSLNVQVGDSTESMIALSIAHKTKRTRVLDGLTISGNVIPAQAGQKVVISGNNIKKSVDSSNSFESADSTDSLTLTTDEKGYFQGSVTPIHAGLLTLTAQSNGITSNTAEIFILPAKTNIALSSNVNQSTKKGDILRVQGIITPVRLDGTKVNLDIRYLDPANQDAGLQPQFVGGVEIDANGVFYRDVVVPGNGFINVKASLPETSDYLSINTKLVIPIGQPVGEGIIVVSESGNEDFQIISKSLGSYVYNALKSRNIPAERIKYLGIADDPKFTNGTANKANLHDALTNWATSLFSTDDPYKTPLNLYLIGRVEDDNGFKDENNGFRLNDSEVLTADDLAQYLNEAEEIIKTNSKDNYSEYKGFPVTIVLEGTQSGKWIEKIAGNGRIILTSSSDKPIDEGGFAGYDNLGESSFSRYFYQFINYGSDIEGSFAEASYEILKFYRHIQRPVMDADGDGFGTTSSDSYEASGKFIEYRPSGNLRPQIRTTNPDLTINRGDAQNNFLWAIATDPENEMGGVFCSISSITDPSNRTVNIEMKLDTGYFYKADLNQNYPNLATGCYQAVYYAKDKAGNVSLPEQKFLNVIASSG